VVVLARLGQLLLYAAIGACAVWLVLRTLSWLVRRPWIYSATIRGFEAQPVPEGALLFLGSSTIRLWDTLARDFAPWPVVNRGFGGAVVSQINHFAPRLLPASPAPRAIVFYCGGNDVAWGVRRSDIVAGVERFIAFAKERLPDTPVFLLSVGKTPSRFFSWRRVDRLNENLRSLAERVGAHWVDMCTPMLSPRGRPRRSLYLFDGIHPSPAGYAIWTSVLRARLEAELGPPSAPSAAR
jgi:lysophospholipase L1-like esterase